MWRLRRLTVLALAYRRRAMRLWRSMRLSYFPAASPALFSNEGGRGIEDECGRWQRSS